MQWGLFDNWFFVSLLAQTDTEAERTKVWKRKESLNLKIATYNIWNSESGMPYRIKYIVNEINLKNNDKFEQSSERISIDFNIHKNKYYFKVKNYLLEYLILSTL